MYSVIWNWSYVYLGVTGVITTVADNLGRVQGTISVREDVEVFRTRVMEKVNCGGPQDREGR